MRRFLTGLLGALLLCCAAVGAHAAQLDTAAKQAATQAKQSRAAATPQSTPAPAPADSVLKQFSSTAGRFTVILPGTPTTSSQQINVGNDTPPQQVPLYEFAVSTDNDNIAYMVFYNDYPAGYATDGAPAVLARARDAIAEGKTLLTDTAIDYNGVPGRAFTVHGPDGFGYDIRQYLDGQRLYQVMIVTSSGYTAKYRDAFMNSFKLTDAMGQTTAASTNANAPRPATGPVTATPAPAPTPSAPPASPASDLKQFYSADGGFSVLMPGTPQTDQTPEKLNADPQGRSITMYSFVVSTQNDNVAYLVTYNDYPPDVANDGSDAVMQRVRDGASSGKTILTDAPITLGAVPGRAFVFRGDDGTTFDEHEYFIGHRLYQLMVVTAKDYTAADRDAFMNSFAMTGR